MTDLNDKVFLLSRRWPHHSDHSGYGLLGNYVGQALTSNPVPDFLLPNRVFWRLTRNMMGYDRTGFALELLAARHMATHHRCLYHVLHGESCYNLLGILNGWRGHRVIASFHHPPCKFAERVRTTQSLKLLSAVIIVGKNQYSLFEGILSPERIFFVPHPIDTSFFTPPRDFSHREDDLCLFVGVHLRDLATLCLVIEDARLVVPQLKFVVVAHPQSLSEFEGVVGHYTLSTGLAEADLLRWYRKATLLIQPLQDGTANNAMLEAMSCGLPMVVTDVGAVRDYTNDDCAVFVPPYNSDAMLDAIVSLVNDQEKRKRMSTYAREWALTLDWHVVARQMREVYAQILGFT